MNPSLLQNLGKSALRILGALALVCGVLVGCYLIWQPGSNAPLPRLPNNAIWLGHGWLGDDGWFQRNRRNVADFHDMEKISSLLRKLRDHGIATVYPHLCPA